MGFLKRVLGGGPAEPTGPGWAVPMNAEEADALVATCTAHLDHRGVPHRVGDGFLDVEIDGQPNQFGLSNLAQLCHGVSREEWREVVAEHFDNILAAFRDEARLDEEGRDLDKVRHRLKVRIYPGVELGGMEPREPVSWELAPGLTASFVYDLPTTVRSASEEHVAAWGVDRDSLLSIARDNLRVEEVTCEPMTEGGASAPMACFADHLFAASRAFLLDELLPSGAEYGAVFAVPNRHALLHAPIVDLGVVESINRILLVAASLFEQGPGSISPSLYWWRGGDVTLLPASVEGSSVQFTPPDEFVSVLNALPAPES